MQLDKLFLRSLDEFNLKMSFYTRISKS